MQTNMAIDGVAISMILSACAVFLHRGFAVGTAIVLSGTVLSVVHPPAATVAFSLSSALAFIASVGMHRSWQASAERRK